VSNDAPVVAIDGPSGAGKGTVARRVAARLGFHLLDSGALYRLLAMAADEHGVDEHDDAGLVALAAALDVEFPVDPAEDLVRPLLDGRDVGDAIRTERCGAMASRIAAREPVRAALLERQRAFRRPPGLVADGRDMGSVVFPDAEVKIFLTASPEERARRRYKQLIEKGINANLADLIGEISARDERDRERAVAPLRAARDAAVVDSTNMDVDAVCERVLELVSSRGLPAC